MLKLILLLFIIFAFLYEYFGNKDEKKSGKQTFDDDVLLAMAGLFSITMMADGSCTKGELGIVKNFLRTNLNEKKAKQTLKYMNKIIYAKEKNPNKYCIIANQKIKYKNRFVILQTLILIAHQNQGICAAERALLSHIAKCLAMTSTDYNWLMNNIDQKIAEHYQKNYYQHRTENKNQYKTNTVNAKEWAYKTLGLPYNASAEDVKKKYRQLVFKYHPDKQTDASEATKKACSEKLVEINKAYSILKV